jgi:hypothetical protein
VEGLSTVMVPIAIFSRRKFRCKSQARPVGDRVLNDTAQNNNTPGIRCFEAYLYLVNNERLINRISTCGPSEEPFEITKMNVTVSVAFFLTTSLGISCIPTLPKRSGDS